MGRSQARRTSSWDSRINIKCVCVWTVGGEKPCLHMWVLDLHPVFPFHQMRMQTTAPPCRFSCFQSSKTHVINFITTPVTYILVVINSNNIVVFDVSSTSSSSFIQRLRSKTSRACNLTPESPSCTLLVCVRRLNEPSASSKASKHVVNLTSVTFSTLDSAHGSTYSISQKVLKAQFVLLKEFLDATGGKKSPKPNKLEVVSQSLDAQTKGLTKSPQNPSGLNQIGGLFFLTYLKTSAGKQKQ